MKRLRTSPLMRQACAVCAQSQWSLCGVAVAWGVSTGGKQAWLQTWALAPAVTEILETRANRRKHQMTLDAVLFALLPARVCVLIADCSKHASLPA